MRLDRPRLTIAAAGTVSRSHGAARAPVRLGGASSTTRCGSGMVTLSSESVSTSTAAAGCRSIH